MKKKDILITLFIFISIFSIIIIKPINDLDEIWNYNTARAISEGLIPYKDISMITTPLLPIITSIFLKIVSNEIIISRILATIIWTGIIFTIYKIIKTLIKEENISLIITALIGILCKDIYCIDYNIAVLLISLIILYQELKNYNKKNDLIIGILAGLAICTKQSIGATLAIIVVIYKALFIENKEQFKQYIKTISTRIIGILIPITIIFIYIIITGALTEFINYAVLGISTFSNKIPYTQLLQNEKIQIKILSIIMPISILLMAIIVLVSKILKKENENTSKILTILIYSLSIIIVMYPISDEIHFLIGAIIPIIGLIYTILLICKKMYNQIKDKYKIYKIISLSIWIAIFYIILTQNIYTLYTYINTNKNKEIQHYKNIIINDYLKERITEIDQYILEKEKQGKKVYILDAEAGIYMIPINKYNKNYDMFLKGNIGKDGEQGQIQKIKERKENELYLIRKKELNLNWQTPIEVINYIRNNLELVEEISIYEVFK